jgi:hypothetical protein
MEYWVRSVKCFCAPCLETQAAIGEESESPTQFVHSVECTCCMCFEDSKARVQATAPEVAEEVAEDYSEFDPELAEIFRVESLYDPNNPPAREYLRAVWSRKGEPK